MASPTKNQTVEQRDPQSIYDACFDRERNVLKDWQRSHELVYRLCFLERPIFPASTFVPKGAGKFNARDRDILDRAFLGGRCQVIFSRLKDAANIEQRWEILASWLKQEGVCEPQKILPFSLGQLARKRFAGISRRDALYASLVEIWGPYFTGLMADIPVSGLTDRVKDRLRKLNYNHEAITFAGVHKDPIPAVCEWLASRDLFPKTVDAQTIRNAHSRTFGGRFRQASFFSKRGK